MEDLLKFAQKLRLALRANGANGFLTDFPGCVAGGCFRALATNSTIRDIDVFYNDAGCFQQWMSHWNSQNPRHVITRDPAVKSIWNLHLPGFPLIQFIGFRQFTSHRDLVEQFDWRCCAMAFDFDTGDFYSVPGAIEDCRDMILVPQIKYANMGVRVAKYESYGFRKCEYFDDVLEARPIREGLY